MEGHKEKNSGAWLSVPQFGDWDHQKGPFPDYSVDFSKIREMRKQNKREVSRASIGNDDDLLSSSTPGGVVACLKTDQDIAPTTRRRMLSCFNCCVKA